MEPKPPFPPTLGILVAVVAVSFSSIFVKWCDAPPAVIADWRLWLAVVALSPWLIKEARHLSALSWRDSVLLVTAGMGLGLHLWLWTASLFYTSVASSTILLALQPFLVLAGEYVLEGKRQRGASWLSVAGAIIGIVLITGGDLRVSGAALYGDLLAVLSTVAVSVYMLAGQAARRHLSSTTYSAVVFLIASVPLTLIAIAQHAPFVGFSARTWWMFVLLALVPTVGGHFLFNALLRYVSAGLLSVSILGEPVGASVLAWLLLGQPLHLLQAVGGLLTLIGVASFLRPAMRYADVTQATANDPPPTVPSNGQ
jgi:drug/metabolite transporter (DMT)-like permease